MTAESEVTVTITPGGAIRDITVGGHSIAAAVPRGAADLTLEAGEQPRIRFALAASRIVVKEDDSD